MKTCIIFICHNQETIDSVSHHLIHDNIYIIAVGNSEFIKNERIIVAREQPYNIEEEKQLLTLTAWYAIVKNNLFNSYDSYCILEYDCIINDIIWFQDILSKNDFDVISFFKDENSFLVDVDETILYTFLRSKNIYTKYKNEIWGCSTNKCIKKEILYDFIDWYYPYCLYFKIGNYYNYSYYHERLFHIYITYYNVGHTYILDNRIVHNNLESHSISRYLPIYDFDWKFYLNNNIDVYKSLHYTDKLTQYDAIKHFINFGYKEKRIYKPIPKKYFVLYDDETNRYDLNPLIESIKKYLKFEIIIFKKSNIDSSFLENNKDIFAFSRGGGYWLWKPYIINEVLKNIEPGSFLFYIDSSYKFINNIDDIISYVDKKDIIIWKNKPNEPYYLMNQWCKKDVLQTPDNYEICWAGAILVKNTLYCRSIIEEWLKSCNYHSITDSPSIIPNLSKFVEHHHDQALLSNVLFKYNVPLHFLSNNFLYNNRNP
jgi:hypothetical protein